MIGKFTNYFIQGLIFLAPITITIYIFYAAFVKIDGWLGLDVRGAGFVITIVGVTLLGFLTTNFLTRSVFSILERLMSRLPFVKLLHSSLKDVLTAFVGERKKFDKPVAVSIFPGSSIKAFGFMTSESLENYQHQDHVAVYFPQSFNIAGNLLIYPRSQVTPLEVNSSRLMAFIVSGGTTE